MERSVRALLPEVTTMTEWLPDVMISTEGNFAGGLGARWTADGTRFIGFLEP